MYVFLAPFHFFIIITTLPTLEKTALLECINRLDNNQRQLVVLVTTEIVSEGNVETDRSALASEKDTSAVNNKVEVLHCA